MNTVRHIENILHYTYEILTGKCDVETAPPPLGWGLFLSNERSQLEITKIGQNMIYVSFGFW